MTAVADAAFVVVVVVVVVVENAGIVCCCCVGRECSEKVYVCIGMLALLQYSSMEGPLMSVVLRVEVACASTGPNCVST